ncbi:OLC1v1021560C1 [Oldenlandia corymbosa var. corymbosa]|uniref:OLC1v1021560C1 n=1 Tax=Oldenlandia corymbosa var. corymbosa TaxID=529605 RepID=A0AAV1BVY5_OLDCO|nr:OLC1v1021560C1 [Oldenlandia corymbosa var. corymbosa]
MKQLSVLAILALAVSHFFITGECQQNVCKVLMLGSISGCPDANKCEKRVDPCKDVVAGALSCECVIMDTICQCQVPVKGDDCNVLKRCIQDHQDDLLFTIKKNTCWICNTSTQAGGEAIFTAECSHEFHYACITSYGGGQCPACGQYWSCSPTTPPTWLPLPHIPYPPVHFDHEPSAFNDDEPLDQNTNSSSSNTLYISPPQEKNKRKLKTCTEVPAVAQSSAPDNFTVLINLKAPSANTDQSSRGTRRPGHGSRREWQHGRMSESGRRQALEAVKRLRIEGGTNIAEGLRTGAKCIGGLLSVVAKEVQVNIECVDPRVSLTSLKKGSYVNQLTRDGRMGNIDAADLYADEERDFLVTVKLPAEKGVDETALLKVRCVYSVPLTKELVTVSSEEVKLARPEEVGVGQQDVCVEVDRQRNRLQVAEAMVLARAAAERGDLIGAASILGNCWKKMSESVSAKARDTQWLAMDAELKEMEARVATRPAYESSGEAYMLAAARAHKMQRAGCGIAFGAAADACYSGASYSSGGGRFRGSVGARGMGASSSSFSFANAAGPNYGQIYQTPAMANMVTQSQAAQLGRHNPPGSQAPTQQGSTSTQKPYNPAPSQNHRRR